MIHRSRNNYLHFHIEISGKISDTELGDEEEEIFDFPGRHNRIVRSGIDKMEPGIEEFFEPYNEKEIGKIDSMLSKGKEVHIGADEVSPSTIQMSECPWDNENNLPL